MNKFQNEDFADIMKSNSQFVAKFEDEHLTGTARRGLAIVTCMDSRINPLAVVGMRSGDAKILRNAGARVTDDMLRTLVLATYLLGVERVLVMPHTDCRMASGDEESIHRSIETKHGVDTRGVQFKMVTDQRAALAADVVSIRGYEILPKTLKVAGAIYDVKSGQLEFIDC
ncbi:MAG: carbonic anhydrase [Acidimicrobium sp. BACL27 MAG-120823-bin4]|jgi:carbonic anhydrase|nr:MAG: carbonic anhydrase [Acidimicrobium sp. BACL27 MAG-120823-bin4]